MNSHTTHLSPQATASRKRLATGGVVTHEAQRTPSSEVAAAGELQAFPSSRLFNRTAVESSRTSLELPPSPRRGRSFQPWCRSTPSRCPLPHIHSIVPSLELPPSS